MDAAAWLVEFAARDDAWRAATALRHRLMGERIARELHPVVESHSRFDGVVILEPGHEIDSESDGAPSSARSAGLSALALGWAVRYVRSVAAVPRKGVCTVVTLRARRHEERLWAAWWNGSYDCGWYVGPTGLERLMASRVDTRVKLAATAAAKSGGAPRAVTERGLLDAIEGIRLQ